MPTRRDTNHKVDAAIERRMQHLRQIPARIEAEQLIAKMFAEEGRPLHSDETLQDISASQPSVSEEEELDPWREGRVGFLVGCVIGGAVFLAGWFLLS